MRHLVVKSTLSKNVIKIHSLNRILTCHLQWPISENVNHFLVGKLTQQVKFSSINIIGYKHFGIKSHYFLIIKTVTVMYSWKFQTQFSPDNCVT